MQGELTKLIKIGYTKRDPNQRLHDLQAGSPDTLKLLMTIDGDKKFEWTLHRRFAKYRKHREWFEPHPTLLRAIEEQDFPKSKKSRMEILFPRKINKNRGVSGGQNGELIKTAFSWFVRWYAGPAQRRMKRLGSILEFPTRESVEPAWKSFIQTVNQARIS